MDRAAAEMSAGLRIRVLAAVLLWSWTIATQAGTGPVSPDLDYEGQPLAAALTDLRRQGLDLVYSSLLVEPGMRVAAHRRGVAPRDLLDELLAQHGLRARPGPGGRLLVVRGPPDPRGLGAIHGRIRDRDGMGLEEVIVAIAGQPWHALTDRRGFFTITGVPPGSWRLRVQRSGFLQHERDVTLSYGQTREVAVRLAPMPTHLENIVVTPSSYQLHWQGDGRNMYLGGDELERIPALSQDPYRAISRLPGVSQPGPSARFHIRGGEADEVLILFDGMELIEPFHLREFLGFFSFFDAAAVSDIRFSSGGFSARYGNRLSGVADIRSRSPEAPSRTELGLDLFFARALHQGRSTDGDTRWLATARGGDLGLFLAAGQRDGDRVEPVYADFFAKVSHRLSPRHTIAVHLLGGADRLRVVESSHPLRTDARLENDVTNRYRQTYAWLSWEAVWREGLRSRWQVSAGRLDQHRLAASAQVDDFFFEDEEIRYFEADDRRDLAFHEVKQDAVWDLGVAGSLRFGFAWRRGRADYRYAAALLETSPFVTDGVHPVFEAGRADLSPSGSRYGAYLSASTPVSTGIKAEWGLRWDRHDYLPERRDQISPRLGALFDLGELLSLRLGWGRFFQAEGLHQLPVADGVETFAASRRADHWLVSLRRLWPRRVESRLELYYKDIDEPGVRFENPYNPISLYPEAAPERIRIDPQRARAHGVELSFKRTGDLTWLVNYSYGVAEDFLDGVWVARQWQHRHLFNASLLLPSWRGWDFSLAAGYRGGRPITAIETVAVPDGEGGYAPRVVLGERNADRLPSSHQLDLRAARTKPVGRGQLTYFFEVNNLYDRENLCCVRYEFSLRPDGEVRTRREDTAELRLLPSIGLTWTF